MNILILGAGGFIGSNMVEYLLARDEHDVVGIDVDGSKLRGIAGPRFHFRRADVTRATRLVEREVAAADVVVDLIAYANPSLYVKSPLDIVHLNYTTNAWIVELCVRHGKRLIQFSTSEVYGKPSGETFIEDESDLRLGPVTRPRWIYACSKQLLERVIHAHGQAGDLEYTIVRPFNFIGPRFDYLVPAGTKGGPRVFSHFLSAMLTSGPIYLVDGGDQRRAFTHINDAMTCFQFFLDEPAARNQVINVGNPANQTSIRDMAVMMMRLYEELTGEVPRCEMVEIDGPEFYGAGYEDSTRVPPDISKALSLGWEPVYDLETTLRDSMRHTLEAEAASAGVKSYLARGLAAASSLRYMFR